MFPRSGKSGKKAAAESAESAILRMARVNCNDIVNSVFKILIVNCLFMKHHFQPHTMAHTSSL